MNDKRVVTEGELKQRLDEYLHVTTNVEPTPRVMEISAMSLHRQAKIWKHFRIILVVVSVGIMTTVVALAARNSALFSPAYQPPTSTQQAQPSPTPGVLATSLTFTGPLPGPMHVTSTQCITTSNATSNPTVAATGTIGGVAYEFSIDDASTPSQPSLGLQAVVAADNQTTVYFQGIRPNGVTMFDPTKGATFDLTLTNAGTLPGGSEEVAGSINCAIPGPSPAPAPAATPAGLPVSLPAGWKPLSDAQGRFSFGYPAAWTVSGPCANGPQMAGEPASQQVLVGPRASGCGTSAGAAGVDLLSTPGSTTSQMEATQSQYGPGTTVTNTGVTVDGVAGVRQTVIGSGVDFIQYLFVTNGIGYQVVLDRNATAGITTATLGTLVTQTFRFAA